MINSENLSSSFDMKSFQGKTLRGTYLLQEYIHEGNFGAVFKSEQQFLGVPVRRVAVKISKETQINIDLAKDIFAEVFLLAEAMDEMTDAGAKSHLVHIYDAGILPEQDNRMFVVMEYVQGTTLAEQFRSYRRVPAPLLLKWVRQICRALQGLHTLVPPVLHRDLKPDNILLGIHRNVLVVDFGLAARLLHCGYVPGVAGMVTSMAPETTCGESIPASDVYSIGLILYEGITGAHPFAHVVPPIGLPEALYSDWLYNQKSTVRPVPPSAMNNTVTPELDAVILRCLEFKSGKRFHNAGELLNALDHLLKPSIDSPGADDVATLNEGRRLKDTGDLDGARLCFERGLAAPSTSKQTRFDLLYELGGVLKSLKDYKDAATRLAEAWELARDSAILRSRRERAKLLGDIKDGYRLSGNDYQAYRYEKLQEQELQTQRRSMGL